MEPASAANAENASAGLQRRCTTLGVPSLVVLVSDTAARFKDHLLAMFTTLLGVGQRFVLANSPWTNRTVANVMKGGLRVVKALLDEYRTVVTDWEHFAPMVQWASNSSYRARLGCSPYNAWLDRESTTLLASLVRDQHTVSLSPTTLVRAIARDLIVAVDVIHKQVTLDVQAVRAGSRRRESKGVLPNFAVGDYVLMVRVRPLSGAMPNFLSTWTESCRANNASSPQVYLVQDIVSGKVTNTHVTRLKFDKKSSLGVIDVQEAF